MIGKRLEHIEKVNPAPDQSAELYELATRWRTADGGREQWRRHAEPIFERHPEWKATPPDACARDKALYIEWQCFVGYLHRGDLEPVLFDTWIRNGQTRAEAEVANELYIKFTGSGIPITPLYVEADRAAWELYFTLGTGYDEKLEKLRRQYR